MTLYNSHKNFSPWKGEPINDVRHPKVIEHLWSNTELQEIGLYKDSMIVDQGVPEGKTSTGKSIQVIDGVPTWVHNLIDTPVVVEELPILKPYQFWGMVKASGNEDNLRLAISSIVEPEQKAVAEAMLEYSLEFRRDHPLVATIRGVLQMTEAELDTLWVSASTL